MTDEANVLLDLNNPVFQADLFALQKAEKLAALKTLAKIASLTWVQLYRDHGLKWEKIIDAPPSKGGEDIYSLRISQSCRATAYRQGNIMRFVNIFPDHDATYGKK